ncbi:hypothetical protein GCM10018773_16310 [Streptomyces candidus]|nr:hypothetical protein GCM10018773_16310 [Streptomyces candidus]
MLLPAGLGCGPAGEALFVVAGRAVGSAVTSGAPVSPDAARGGIGGFQGDPPGGPRKDVRHNACECERVHKRVPFIPLPMGLKGQSAAVAAVT